ncbi:MAG: hypothetical protein EAZ92_12005 [Candidatus Kapaibacterium sp.]|nr:MAG: hypothetical protein EAZ92_12005 [Candidatus Kapabacteria bacterium]
MFTCCCFSAMSSCAQPRYVLGGGFPGRPISPGFTTYGQPRGFFQRGPIIVPPPAIIVPRRNFAPRFGGWGGGRGRRWGC